MPEISVFEPINNRDKLARDAFARDLLRARTRDTRPSGCEFGKLRGDFADSPICALRGIVHEPLCHVYVEFRVEFYSIDIQERPRRRPRSPLVSVDERIISRQRLQQRSRLREYAVVCIDAECRGPRPGNCGIQQAVVSDLENVPHCDCSSNEHVLAVEEFRHASRRFNSLERWATIFAASRTRRLRSFVASTTAVCANAFNDRSEAAAASLSAAISSSEKLIFSAGMIDGTASGAKPGTKFHTPIRHYQTISPVPATIAVLICARSSDPLTAGTSRLNLTDVPSRTARTMRASLGSGES